MGRTKRLKELTIKDNFMFGAVMMDEDNCKGLLERVLEIQIDRVDVSKEKSIVYHPEYKGVRLDVYAKDEKQTRYNVEMQVERKPALGKRSRYYQSQMIRNFRIPMLFLSVILIHLEKTSIDIPFGQRVRNLKMWIWKMGEPLCF